jgi:U3 small nucleolar RNA-associated protein 6
MTTPALKGAIPIAIFNEARKQPFYCAAVGEEFFNMFAAFVGVHCQASVMQQVLETMTESFSVDAATCNCLVKQFMVGVEPLTADFPAALGLALECLKVAMEKTNDKALLAKKTTAWIEPILSLEDLDSDIQTVLRHTLKKLQ